ncbi:innexin inx2-like [Stegodyphus dumicola]|uniref:innexin inx2-like n=1 Tax=Stegodyphus dumicola TaxID=202533 RepID=UPI0015AC1147|nr:innexin inx2-like [Stegodyphus dumicola]
MFDVFGSLRGLIKLDGICVDNNIFRLHYKFTVLVLVAFSILVTCRQYFGDPIDCIQNDDVPENVLETFCWIHTTFTLPDAWNKKVGVEVPHPGIDRFTPGETRKYHSYYQWVCFVLFLQAIFFYIPRYLWKTWEGGTIKTLVMGLNSPILKPDEKELNKNLLLGYLKTHLRYHSTYVTCFTFCEILNFINVIGQIYLIDTFLGGEFSRYGVEVLKFTDIDQEYRTDPMVKVFPRMTKCTFHRYGPSGDVQRYDALCILPLNILNEKIYIFLWFWFVILAVLSALILVYRLMVIFWPASRFIMLRSRSRIADKKDLHIIMSRANLGDWFVLYLLCKNLDPMHFRDLVHDFARELKDGERLLGKRSLDDYKSI